MKLENLFKGDGGGLKIIENIFGTIGNLGGNRKNVNKETTKLCNSKVITMELAYSKILEGSTLILDVRTKNEYNIIKIKGSINIPVDKLEYDMTKFEPNRNREILVYCANGERVKRAVQTLYRLGYNNVLVWDGGGINNFKFLDVIEKNEAIMGTHNVM